MSSATISECGSYRYTLHRRIPSVLRWIRPCLFVMLNPSVADDEKDDPTIRRCLGFAKSWGCTDLTVRRETSEERIELERRLLGCQMRIRNIRVIAESQETNRDASGL